MKLIKISSYDLVESKKLFEQLEEAFPSINQIEYDYDLDKEEIKKYGIITKLPVIILYDNDKEISRIVGSKSMEYIYSVINRN